jgi:D-glycero-D-manno-heptose 1,7-bisphosphate phosphatase
VSGDATASDAGRPAVFLDRDGTITVERGYVTDPEDLELIEGAGPAIRSLNEAGFLVVVVSNQSGVARGLMTEDDLAAVHRALERLLAGHGARLDAAYYCPNHAAGVVERFTRDTSHRKPELGMLRDAVRDLGMDVTSSVMVGDQITDVEFALSAGMDVVVVETGKGAETVRTAAERGIEVTACLPDIAAAAEWIISRVAHGDGGEAR